MPQTDNKEREHVSIFENNQFVTTSIYKREDKGIIIMEKELQMADNTVSALDISSEVLVIFASASLGYILNITPHLTKNYVFGIAITVVLFIIGFYLKRKKTTAISGILKMYKD